jgi:hypothetical protein
MPGAVGNASLIVTMPDTVYFEGDPEFDSSRRHMERVLKGETTRKWPWLLAALAGGGLFALWRAAGQAGNGPKTEPRKPGPK